MICFKPKELKTSPNSALQQVSIIYFHYKPMKSYIGIKARMVLFVLHFFFFEKTKEKTHLDCFLGLFLCLVIDKNLIWMVMMLFQSKLG